MIETLTTTDWAVLNLHESPPPQSFLRLWNEQYAHYEHISKPDLYPPWVLDTGIPIPLPEAARVLQSAGGRKVADYIYHKTGTNKSGNEVMFPLAIVDHQLTPIVAGMSVGDFEGQFGFRPTEAMVGLFRTYYQINTMITGGMDSGLECARALEAVAIAKKHASPDNTIAAEPDDQLKRMFGLPNFPSEYINALLAIEQLVNADDHGIRALEFMVEHGHTMPLEAARQEIIEQPGVFLTYLIDQAARMVEFDKLIPDEFYVQKLERLAHSLTDANIGQQVDRNDYVHTNINDAISFIKDLLMAKHYPYAFAVANHCVDKKVNIYYPLRFNSHFLACKFIFPVLDGNNIVSRQALDDGQVTVRANIKPARALAMEVLRDDQIWSQIDNTATTLGYQPPHDQRFLASLDIDGKTTRPLMILNELISQALTRQDFDPTGLVSNLISTIEARMDRQYDINRARVYFQNAETLNYAVRRILDLVETEQDAYIRAGIFTMDKSSSQNTFQIFSDDYGEDPAGYMIDWILQLPEDTLGYIAFHTHLAGIEVQMSLAALRPMFDLDERVHKSHAKTCRSAGFHEPIVNKCRRSVQAQVSK